MTPASERERGKTGWWNPQPWSSRSKWHFIGEDGRSLCGKWAHFQGPLEEGIDGSPDNCAECKRRHAKLAARSGTEAGEQ